MDVLTQPEFNSLMQFKRKSLAKIFRYELSVLAKSNASLLYRSLF